MNATRTVVTKPESADLATQSVVRQMATDAYLLQQTGTRGEPVFRVYRMEPPAVTIGRHQRFARVIDEHECAMRGWEWARRPTGGGALLHRNEINYAIFAPRGIMAPPGKGEFRAVFDLIGRALAKALGDMGYASQLHVGGRASHQPQHGLCGRSITGNEIAVDGCKMIAAAQLITPTGVLQHGTIYLTAPTDLDRFWPLQQLQPEELTQRWTGLGLRWRDVPWDVAAGEFESAFRRHLDLPCGHFNPEPSDMESIDRICRDWEQCGWQKSR